jgi:hypothetical protein
MSLKRAKTPDKEQGIIFAVRQLYRIAHSQTPFKPFRRLILVNVAQTPRGAAHTIQLKGSKPSNRRAPSNSAMPIAELVFYLFAKAAPSNWSILTNLD